MPSDLTLSQKHVSFRPHELYRQIITQPCTFVITSLRTLLNTEYDE